MNIETEIIERYLQNEKITQLSKDYGWTKDKIRYFLKKRKVFTQRKIGKCDIPENDVISLYKSNHSIDDIAKKFKVSVSPIVSILKKHDIRKPNWLKNLSYSDSINVLDKDYFVALVDKHITKKNLMEELSCGYEMITSLCKYHNITLQSSGMGRSLLNQKCAEYDCTSKNFEFLYVNERYSLEMISKKFAISVGYLRKLIKNEWDLSHVMRTGDQTNSSYEYQKYKDDVKYLQRLVDEEKTLIEISKILNCCKDSVFKLLKFHNIEIPVKYRSTAEKEVGDFVTEICNQDVIFCDKKTIYPYELDIYIPNENLAIEYCGLYWHSELAGKDKNYHLNKVEMCEKKNIRLITIFEDEYDNNKDIVLSKLQHIMKKTENLNINSRSCTVKEIGSTTKSEFLTKNHIQGNDRSSIKLGLYTKDEQLVSVMTFAKPSRIRNSKQAISKKNDWELSRFASDISLNVRGACGKLLAYFKRTYEWNTIFSYADRRWSVGDMYEKMGFSFLHYTKPNYWYLNSRNEKREYRYKYTKYKLIEDGFPKNKSEKEIMKDRGYSRIWDCGLIKYQMDNKGIR